MIADIFRDRARIHLARADVPGSLLPTVARERSAVASVLALVDHHRERGDGAAVSRWWACAKVAASSAMPIARGPLQQALGDVARLVEVD